MYQDDAQLILVACRDKIFTMRDDWIIYKEMMSRHLDTDEFGDVGSKSNVSISMPSYYASQKLVADGAFDKQYRTVDEMIRVRGRDMVLDRMTFLRTAEKVKLQRYNATKNKKLAV